MVEAIIQDNGFEGLVESTSGEGIVVLIDSDRSENTWSGNETFSGTVLFEGRSDYALGHYRDDWFKSHFKKFNASITLQNK